MCIMKPREQYVGNREGQKSLCVPGNVKSLLWNGVGCVSVRACARARVHMHVCLCVVGSDDKG